MREKGIQREVAINFISIALSENKPDLRVLYPAKPSFKSKMKQDSLSQQDLSQVPPERTYKGCSNINRFK